MRSCCSFRYRPTTPQLRPGLTVNPPRMLDSPHRRANASLGEWLFAMEEELDALAAQISKKEYGDQLSADEAAIVRSAFAELFASVLRYVRGAGDVRTLVDNLRTASAVVGQIDQCTQMHVDRHLRDASEWKYSEMKERTTAEQRSIETICEGALQLVASRILGPRQGGFEDRGFEEIIKGVEKYLESRDGWK
jgi:hypothetical protein